MYGLGYSYHIVLECPIINLCELWKMKCELIELVKIYAVHLCLITLIAIKYERDVMTIFLNRNMFNLSLFNEDLFYTYIYRIQV